MKTGGVVFFEVGLFTIGIESNILNDSKESGILMEWYQYGVGLC